MYAWSMQLEKLGFALKLKLGWRLEKASDKGDAMFKANAGKRSRDGTCVLIKSAPIRRQQNRTLDVMWRQSSTTEEEELTGKRACNS